MRLRFAGALDVDDEAAGDSSSSERFSGIARFLPFGSRIGSLMVNPTLEGVGNVTRLALIDFA